VCTAYSLIVLFFGDLFGLIKQLADSQLQVTQLVLCCNLLIVVGLLTDVNAQVNTLTTGIQMYCKLKVNDVQDSDKDQCNEPGQQALLVKKVIM